MKTASAIFCLGAATTAVGCDLLIGLEAGELDPQISASSTGQGGSAGQAGAGAGTVAGSTASGGGSGGSGTTTGSGGGGATSVSSTASAGGAGGASSVSSTASAGGAGGASSVSSTASAGGVGGQPGTGGAGGAGSTGGVGGAGGDGGGGGAGPECNAGNVAEKCGASTTCKQLSCPSGQCVVSYPASGTACMENGGEVCDGAGQCVPCSGVLQVVAGHKHACARFANGTVKCWGDNDLGQLGLGDTADRGDNPNEMGNQLPAVDLGTGRTAKAISSSGTHTCALLDNDAVKCWGFNTQGQLGLGDAAARGDQPGEMGDDLPAVDLGAGRFATAISAGGSHTCAILDDATMKCWGFNSSGQLGLGVSTNQVGDNPGEMGDNLAPVNLGAGEAPKAIVAGHEHTCARLQDDDVKCWGYAGFGSLGLGDTENRGDVPAEMGDNLPVVSLGAGRTAKQLTASYRTCALLDDDSVKCWGWNLHGALGLGDQSNRGDGPGEMGDSLPAVSLGSGHTAIAVEAGSFQTCAVLDSLELKCWGLNSVGQLGLGNLQNRGDGPGEMGDALPALSLGTGATVQLVSAGSDFACAKLGNGDVKCWGYNDAGQLGLGDTQTRGDTLAEMGDNLPALVFGGLACP